MFGKVLLFFLAFGLFTIGTQLQFAAGVSRVIEIPEKIQAVEEDAFGLELSSDPFWEEKFQRLLKRKAFNGTVLIAEKGKILHAGSYGLVGKASKGDSLDIQATFQLASVSKTITATAVLQLFQHQLIDSLDQLVTDFIPELPYKGVTIRHLLIHRSGIPRYMPVAEKHWDPEQPLSNQDMLCLLDQHQVPPYFSPGNGFTYTNTNYALLALLVERVSQLSFPEYVQRYIFEPAGMKTARVVPVTDTLSKHAVPGMRRWGRRYRSVARDFLDGVVGDKGVYASVLDLYQFDQALYAGTLVDPELLAQAYEPGSPNRKYTNYGLGWRLKHDVDQIVYHFGWWRGFRTAFVRDLTHQRTLIMLSNHDNHHRSYSPWNFLCRFYEPS
jgi:CubicO group peptidase (beta-lactamase class C family)